MNRSTDSVDRPCSHSAEAALTCLVGVEILQRLQDRFTALGRVTVCICTVTGEPITKPSWGSPFSELIGTSPRGNVLFADAIRECVTAPDRKVPSMCHQGLSCFATPIRYLGRELAAIVVGTRSPTLPTPEVVRAIAATYALEEARLLETVNLIDPYSGGTPEAICCFADVLADTIATLYGQASRIEQQLADLSAVHGLTRLLSGNFDLQETLDLTVRRVVEVMNVKACGIRLLDEETGELVVKSVHNLSYEYLRKGPVLLHENAIDAAAFAGEAVYIEDAPSDPRTRYPENARLEGIVSGLCVPMTYHGKTVGVIRVYTAKRYRFSDSDESLLRSIGSQAASAIINSRLYEEQAAAERFKRQVEAAGQIQRRMLPAQPPHHSNLEFGCVYAPTLQVGGDFYDFIEMPGGRLGVCIADVVGKGLPAALMMASVRSALRASASSACDVEEAIPDVNRHMWRDTLVGEFATLFFGAFSSDGRTLDYCNAGHPPPVVLRDDNFIELATGGMVIGVHPDATFDHGTLALRPGDVIVLMTDGITDAMDFHDETYGRQRFLCSIRRHRSLDAPQLAQQILWDVRRFVGLAEQTDDTTIVVAKAM